MPLVSVILPVYNSEKYVGAAIQSILTQSWRDLELIVIDDASTDQTLAVVRSFEDERIRVVRKERNTGYTVSLNQGLSLARGKYIARMDADDVSLPERLERQVRFLEQNADHGLCGTWVKTVGEQAGMIKKYPVTHAEISVELLVKSPFCHPSVMLRKQVLEANRLQYDPSREPAEDYHLWVQLVGCTRAYNLPEVLLHYRIHPAQVSRERGGRQQQVTSQVQGGLVQKLNIPFTDEEKQLHAGLVSTERIGDGRQTRALIGWLGRLKEANRVARIFPEPAFGNFIHYYAFRTYSRSLALTPGLLLFGLRRGLSPFAAAGVPLLKKGKLLLKCLAGGYPKVQ